eukprot:scaffold229433_cov14-Tisochrysis_lutea.AAC.1
MTSRWLNPQLMHSCPLGTHASIAEPQPPPQHLQAATGPFGATEGDRAGHVDAGQGSAGSAAQ